MVFNKKISGSSNEKEFVNYFNNKYITDFDLATIGLLETLFGKVDKKLKIRCWLIPGNLKPDIRLGIGDITKNISIKKGVKNEVHTEKIASFIEFLFKRNISEAVLLEIKKYLYADGTIDGSGTVRSSVKDYKQFNNNQNIIDGINTILNENHLVSEIIDRCILKGKFGNLEVDAIIYGVIDDFIWITKNEIKEIILSKLDNYSTALHFGPLTLQPWDRNLKNNPIYENRRHYVQLKWYNISDDIIETIAFIRNR